MILCFFHPFLLDSFNMVLVFYLDGMIVLDKVDLFTIRELIVNRPLFDQVVEDRIFHKRTYVDRWGKYVNYPGI